jgi:hypothetical protein
MALYNIIVTLSSILVAVIFLIGIRKDTKEDLARLKKRNEERRKFLASHKNSE